MLLYYNLYIIHNIKQQHQLLTTVLLYVICQCYVEMMVSLLAYVETFS